MFAFILCNGKLLAASCHKTMRIRHASNNGCKGEVTTAVCSGGGEGNNCLDYKCRIFSNTPILILQHNTMNMTSKLWGMKEDISIERILSG